MNNADTTISRWIAAHPDEIESSNLLSPDDNLDGYVVRRLIGKGSAGEVYEAWHPTLNTSFAIKVYSPRNDTDVARLLAEVQSLAKIRHPHIVSIHHFGEYKGHPFFVMDLAERLPKSLSLAECRRLVAEVASALDKLHASGIVHRDVKPQNILVSDGEYLLADFSVVRAPAVRHDASLENPTIQGEGRMVVGTRGYISPEVLEGEEPTPSCDQFALAATCLELCDEVAKDRRVLGVVQRALSAKPALRFASVAEFASAFASATAPRRIPRIVLLAVAAAAAIVAAVVGWNVFHDQGGQARSNESFDRYDPASDKFAASRKESIRKKIEAYEKEMAEIKSKIAAKHAEIYSPNAGVDIYKAKDADEQLRAADKIVDAETKFMKETIELKQRLAELNDTIKALRLIEQNAIP